MYEIQYNRGEEQFFKENAHLIKNIIEWTESLFLKNAYINMCVKKCP